MKLKIILILTIAGALNAASAQTNVTIYGVADVGFVREDNGARAGSVARMDSGRLNGSRLGFRGREELGNGLSVIFTLENGFSTDTGALGQGGLLFGRQAWVGLSSAYGTVKLGRQMNVIYTSNGTFDPFGNALAGDSARLFNYYGSRTNNTVSYGYEAKNGIRGELDYSFGEVTGDNSASRTVGALLGYRAGGVDAVLAHHRANNVTGSDTAKTTLLAANYDFGFIKPFLAYAWNKGVGAIDTRDALVGFRMPVGLAGTVLGSYIRKTDKAMANADAHQYAVGYLHALTKRTSLYTGYSRLHNDSASTYNVVAPGEKASVFDVGIRHSF